MGNLLNFFRCCTCEIRYDYSSISYQNNNKIHCEHRRKYITMCKKCQIKNNIYTSNIIDVKCIVSYEIRNQVI